MSQANHPQAARLAWFFLLPGFLLMVGTGGLAARLIWEQTALSWQQGPQMVGFALAHGHGPFLLLFCPPLLVLWLLTALVYLSIAFWRTRRIAPTSLQATLSSIALLVLLSLPQNFWIRLFIDRFATSPRAIEFLYAAAVDGDLRTVRSLVERGVSIHGRNHEESTPLHGAARGGNTAVISYLISEGADVNAVSLYGDSPLEDAAARNNTEAMRFLSAHGAAHIKGTDEQRENAAHIIVRKQTANDELRRKEAEQR